MMRLGERIRYIRGSLKQYEFAKIVGTHRNTISAWENNAFTPGLAFILRIYEYFNVNLNRLFSGKGEPIEIKIYDRIRLQA